MIEKATSQVEDKEVKSRGAETLPDGRYLLFDAGCLACSAIADLVERETEGWLTARGLGEPEVRATLCKARPDWKHEPTFLEVEGEKIVASTGLTMRARMLVDLGPRKAARVARIANGRGVRGVVLTPTTAEGDGGGYGVGSMKLIDRRAALKTMGAFGLAAALLPGLPAGALAQGGAGADAPVAAGDVRVRNVRLSFRETLRRLDKMRNEDSRIRMLHRNMIDKGFCANTWAGCSSSGLPIPTARRSAQRTRPCRARTTRTSEPKTPPARTSSPARGGTGPGPAPRTRTR